MDLMKKIEYSQMRMDIRQFKAGDTVKVHVRIIEGDKERIQMFRAWCSVGIAAPPTPPSPCARCPTGSAWSVFFPCILPSSSAWKFSARAGFAAAGFSICASSRARPAGSSPRILGQLVSCPGQWLGPRTADCPGAFPASWPGRRAWSDRRPGRGRPGVPGRPGGGGGGDSALGRMIARPDRFQEDQRPRYGSAWLGHSRPGRGLVPGNGLAEGNRIREHPAGLSCWP
jgi:hypothetical protein